MEVERQFSWFQVHVIPLSHVPPSHIPSTHVSPQDSAQAGDAVLSEGGEIWHMVLNTLSKANALTQPMMAEATSFFASVQVAAHVRALVISGAGKHFCAGADLQWMQRCTQRSDLAEHMAQMLEDLFRALDRISLPKIAVVHGVCAGAGMGLVSLCDSVLAHTATRFMLSEVRLGVIPATILPYLARVMPRSQLQRSALNGSVISAQQALDGGWCHGLYTQDPEVLLQQEVESYLKGSLSSQRALCDIFRQHAPTGFVHYDGKQAFTSALHTANAQKGLKAFQEKTRRYGQGRYVAGALRLFSTIEDRAAESGTSR